MRIIDLTMPVRPHWRWPVSVETVRDFGPGQPFRISHYHGNVHAFTHVDALLHVVPGAPSVETLPLERLAGPASIIDLSDKGPGDSITAADLKQRAAHVESGDIVLLRTSWDLKFSFETREYWTQACYVADDAAEWLFDRSPSAVGYDFPQDPALRTFAGHADIASSGTTRLDGFTTHRLLLARGVINIEYLINLHQISTNRPYLFALPIPLQGAEGAPARVVAVEF